MRIIAKVRPMGIRSGVRTETLYKAMGFKPDHVDVRDVVGTLTLSASGPQDTLFLASLHKAVRSDSEYTLKIFDGKGELVCETNPAAVDVPEGQSQ